LLGDEHRTPTSIAFQNQRSKSAAFASEYQQALVSRAEIDSEELTAEQIIERVNNHERGLVPAGSTRLTAF
jgi:hypothetical protein